jgi:hypothetical protein
LDRILSVAGPQTPVKTQPIFDTDRTPAADDKAVVVARTVEDVNRKRAAAGLPPIEPGDVTAGVVDAKPSGPTSKNPQFWEAIDVVLGVIGSEISKSEEREREDERMKYEMAMKAGPGVGSQGSPYGLMMYPQQMLGQLLALSQRAGTPIQAGAPLNF